jgi:hypothetical protein
MPAKPMELPAAVARRFVDDMRAFHAEPNAIKRDEIAARQAHILQNYQPQRTKKAPALRREGDVRADEGSCVSPSGRADLLIHY